jgi:hypothetical protein
LLPGWEDLTGKATRFAETASTVANKVRNKMAQFTPVLKVLVLCLLALGILVLEPRGAQAELGAEWKSNGENFGFSLPDLWVKEVENNTVSFLYKTKGGTKVEILCTQMKFLWGRLKSYGRLDEHMGIVFHGCLTKLNGSLSKPCEPYDAMTGGSGGLIKTLDLRGLIVLDKGEGVLNVIPETGESGVFSHIFFGEECSIGEKLLVQGVLALRDCQFNFTKDQVDHLFVEGPSALTIAGIPATFDGSFLVTLVGAYTGAKWSGEPA